MGISTSNSFYELLKPYFRHENRQNDLGSCPSPVKNQLFHEVLKLARCAVIEFYFE